MRRRFVMVALVVLAACGDDDVVTDTLTTSAAEAAGELVFFLPDEPGTTSTHPGPASDLGGFGIVLGRPDGDAFVEIVTVFAEEAATDREVADDERALLEDVDVNGITARLMRDSPFGATVDWLQDGQVVGVSGPERAADLVVEVARSLDVSRGADGLDAIPDGYEVVGSYESEGAPSPSWTVDLTEGSTTLGIDGTLVPEGTPTALFAGFGDRIDPVEVRGTSGWLSTSSTTLENTPEITIRTLVWLERPDVLITVRGSAPLDRMLELADSLREVSEEEFLSSS